MAKDNDQDLLEPEQKTKLQKPNMYKVIMVNDDYTTMEFVCYVLMRHFNKTEDEAKALTLEIHNKGLAVVGLYTYEIAAEKCWRVVHEARKAGHPLMVVYEID